MRHLLYILAAFSTIWPTAIFASDNDAVWLSAGTVTNGSVTEGRSQNYFLKASSNKTVTITVNGQSDLCRADVSKQSRNVPMSTISQFPASVSDIGVAGDVYKIAFFQSRTAWVDAKPCAFVLTLAE